jgi:hypothetical protein
MWVYIYSGKGISEARHIIVSKAKKLETCPNTSTAKSVPPAKIIIVRKANIPTPG